MLRTVIWSTAQKLYSLDTSVAAAPVSAVSAARRLVVPRPTF